MNNLKTGIDAMVQESVTEPKQTQQNNEDELEFSDPEFAAKVNEYRTKYNRPASADFMRAWRNIFKEWEEKYPRNKNMPYQNTNEIWEKDGWQQRVDKAEKDFMDAYTREWNYANPSWYYNKELKRYERVDPNRIWNDELGEYE